MKIKCEQCGMVIPSEYIFKKSNMVQCPFCLHESKLSESVVYFGGEDNSYGYKKNLKLPKGMSIKLNRYNLEITYRWFKLEYLFYLLIYGGVGYFWFKGIWGLAGNDIFDSFDIY
ncbi:MAG: hypothetical protein KDK36_08335, partial [Leptospiraceae bacterium]|nr:hypothetical protein [Leptospiraceae bacterium]